MGNGGLPCTILLTIMTICDRIDIDDGAVTFLQGQGCDVEPPYADTLVAQSKW